MLDAKRRLKGRVFVTGIGIFNDNIDEKPSNQVDHLTLSRTVAPGLFVWGFFLPMVESGSPQISILPIAESSVVHKLLLKLFQRISIDFLWKL